MIMRNRIKGRFHFGNHVRFATYGIHGTEEHIGTITYIEGRGGGLHFGVQPTANIRTDEGHYHKNIPFEDIREMDEE